MATPSVTLEFVQESLSAEDSGDFGPQDPHGNFAVMPHVFGSIALTAFIPQPLASCTRRRSWGPGYDWLETSRRYKNRDTSGLHESVGEVTTERDGIRFFVEHGPSIETRFYTVVDKGSLYISE